MSPVLMRKGVEKLAVPYHIFPVHTSNAFLKPATLSAAMMLLVLRFQHRDYAAVCTLVDSVACDEPVC